MYAGPFCIYAGLGIHNSMPEFHLANLQQVRDVSVHVFPDGSERVVMEVGQAKGRHFRELSPVGDALSRCLAFFGQERGVVVGSSFAHVAYGVVKLVTKSFSQCC